MTRSVYRLFLTVCCMAIALVAGLSLGACGAPQSPATPALAQTPKVSPEPSAGGLAPAAVMVSASSEPSVQSASAAAAALPVSAADPQWGSALAPVTIVEFSDFQCPFCARVKPTLKQVQERYPGRVRIVFKHNPLPFHARAMPAAEAASTVFGLAGSNAFWSFYALAFDNQQELSDENFVLWAERSGVAPAQFRKALADKVFVAKVAEDMALSKKLGATGTPAFRINGVTVSGAQPFEKFNEVIEQQLIEAQKLRSAGTPAAEVYAALTNKNLADAEPAAPARHAADDDEDRAVWKVPVLADDPVRGRRDALVTLIIFSDYQCPFCKRVEETLERLTASYGDQLRLVWKDNPLPFHDRARPAADFARFVQSQKGDPGFWAAHDALFDSSPKLADADLQAIAGKLGVNWSAAKAAMTQNRFKSRIDRSIELAEDFQARGTPHFFVNGVRLSGAQPLERFKALVDQELARAQELLAKGVPRTDLYAALIRDGKQPPAPETKQVAPPDATTPSRGAPGARVVIQEFSDFQCPFCKRVQPALRELEREFPGQIKLVWRHLPLPFHEHAALAAEAAQEAFAQKGSVAFWAFHDALFDAQAESEGLARPQLEQLAQKLGLDLPRFQAALDSHRHEQKVKADAAIASQAGINGTPGFVINGYFLAGAQPASAFRKLVKKALAGGKKP